MSACRTVTPLTLLAGYSDLRIKLALNVPDNAPGTYILDALRFEDSDQPPTILLGTSGVRTLQSGVGRLSVFGDSLSLIGQIVDALGVASTTVRINGGTVLTPVLDSTGHFAIDLPLVSDPDHLATANILEVSATDIEGNTALTTVTVTSVGPRYPGEIVILFATGVTEPERAAVLASVGATVRTRITDRLQLVEVAPGTELAALPVLLADSSIRAAIPNFPLLPTRTVNDHEFAAEWHLPRIGATDTWDTAFGSDDVIVAILDSGVAYDSSMFRSQPCSIEDGWDTPDWTAPPLDNIWLNEAECCSSPPCDSACHPSQPQDSTDTCPLADLNGDGCPGICGVDDDHDGAADFADPDVRVLYSNNKDDDGDGLIDEQGPGGTPCNSVSASQMQGAAGTEDCDGAARDDDENGYPDDCRGFQFARVQGHLEDKFGTLWLLTTHQISVEAKAEAIRLSDTEPKSPSFSASSAMTASVAQV